MVFTPDSIISIELEYPVPLQGRTNNCFAPGEEEKGRHGVQTVAVVLQIHGVRNHDHPSSLVRLVSRESSGTVPGSGLVSFSMSVSSEGSGETCSRPPTGRHSG